MTGLIKRTSETRPANRAVNGDERHFYPLYRINRRPRELNGIIARFGDPVNSRTAKELVPGV